MLLHVATCSLYSNRVLLGLQSISGHPYTSQRKKKIWFPIKYKFSFYTLVWQITKKLQNYAKSAVLKKLTNTIYHLWLSVSVCCRRFSAHFGIFCTICLKRALQYRTLYARQASTWLKSFLYFVTNELVLPALTACLDEELAHLHKIGLTP